MPAAAIWHMLVTIALDVFMRLERLTLANDGLSVFETGSADGAMMKSAVKN